MNALREHANSMQKGSRLGIKSRTFLLKDRLEVSLEM